MQWWKYLAVLSVAALLLPATAAARNKNERTVSIGEPVQVGNVHLKPGTYKVEWKTAGPNVNVTFLHNKKTLVTAPATLKTNDAQVSEDDVVMDRASGNRSLLHEIDFRHGKEALIFKQG